MDDEERPLDPTTGWVREHLHRYVATDGENGHEWRGAPTLLLTTRGRRSGHLRRTPLIYGRSGEDYVVVASKGGSLGHPGWFHNLVAHPDVTVEVLGETRAVRARVAGPEERDELYDWNKQDYPTFEEYEQKTDRNIPVVILEPAG